MLPLEHSAILLTCIKRYLVLKTNFRSFLSGSFTQVLLYTGLGGGGGGGGAQFILLVCHPGSQLSLILPIFFFIK